MDKQYQPTPVKQFSNNAGTGMLAQAFAKNNERQKQFITDYWRDTSTPTTAEPVVKQPMALQSDFSGFNYDIEDPQDKQNRIAKEQQDAAIARSEAYQAEQLKQQQAFAEEQRLKSEKFQAEQNALGRASSGGGGGCFITTATVESLGIEDGESVLNEFRHFRDSWLKNKLGGDMLIAKYYDVAPKIVGEIGNLKSVYLLIWAKYLQPCRDLIRAENNDAAFLLYQDMCLTLEEKFL